MRESVRLWGIKIVPGTEDPPSLRSFSAGGDDEDEDEDEHDWHVCGPSKRSVVRPGFLRFAHLTGLL